MALAGVHWLWWVTLAPLAGAVAWLLVEELVLAPRRMTRKFAGVSEALHRRPVRVSAHVWSVEWPVGDRMLAVQSGQFGGSADHVRGPRGRLFVVSTPLRVEAWVRHDLEVRQRHRHGDWDVRFTRVESGVPVREAWLNAEVRQAVAHFFDHPLAVGLVRADRADLQHVAYWSAIDDTTDAAAVRELLARFAALADALDYTARRH